MNGNTEFESLSENKWYIQTPGVLRWENTGFTIVSDFNGPPMFFIEHNDRKVSVAFTIDTAKNIAKTIADDMIQMGLEI